MKNQIPFLLFLITLMVIMSACSQNDIKPESASTVALTAKIDFFTHYDKETGVPLNRDTIFSLHDKGNIRCVVNFDNLSFGKYPVHLVHLDWIGTDEKSIFMKRNDIVSPDNIPLSSSMTISPDKRKPGFYTLKVYYFRDLIAEKSIALIPEGTINEIVSERLKPKVAFGRNISKKSGLLVQKDSVFDISNTRRIHAFVDFVKPEFYENRKLLFTLQWIAPNGSSFYEKKVGHLPGETENFITTSVSVSADKRPTGEYRLKVFLFDELIADKSFLIVSDGI